MKRLSLIAFAVFTAFAAPSFAEDAKLPMAVVNIMQVMKDSTAAKSVREQLDAKQKAFQTEMTKKEESLQKEDQELAKQQKVLSKEAFGEKAKAFRDKVTEVQKEVQSKRALLDNASERAQGDIQKALLEVIAELAKEKGLKLALPMAQTLYSDSGMDITAEVITRLNKKLPKVDVKF